MLAGFTVLGFAIGVVLTLIYVVPTYLEDLEVIRAQIKATPAAKRFRDALKKYGEHLPECYCETHAEPVGCDCGYNDAVGFEPSACEACGVDFWPDNPCDDTCTPCRVREFREHLNGPPAV